ncbi:hypothetical protein PLESTM_000570700 [Pleodorina starrii]|nr:hypothetical protein PLESTM_000570700 [Pleodorina starrii]
MLLGERHEDVRAAFDVLDEVGAELGLEWKASKDRGRDQPLQQLDFLGMLFDTVRMEMRMSPAKRQRYAEAVQSLLAAPSDVPRRELQSVIGRLTFIARACRWGRVFLQSLYDAAFAPLPTPNARVNLPAAAREDLTFWLQTLRADSSVWDGVRRCTTGNIDLVRGDFLGTDGAVIFTDASGRGFGAAWEAAEVQGWWSEGQRGLHIAWLELSAVLRALQSWGPQLASKRVLVRCDNTQAVAAINRGASRLPDSRAISRQIAELAVRHGFELRAEHISGSDNVRADSLSRRLAEADDQQLRLKPSVFEGLCGSGPFKPSVDCCCDNAGFNRQGGCGTFFSPGSSVVGQERALAGRVLWAFPPKALVGEVLGTIKKAWDLDRGTRATVVVPHWPERPWFDWFVRRRLFRVEGTLPRGSRVCLWPWGAEADPAPYDFLVLRLP